MFFQISCSLRILSYLFQVEAAHRRNIDAGSQGAHQGGKHAQQCVPHGFAVIWGFSCSEVKDQDEVRRKRPVEASYILQSPAPHPPPPPVSSSLSLLPLACALQKLFGPHPPACKSVPLHNWHVRMEEGEVRREEKGEWLHNRVLFNTSPPSPASFTNTLACLDYQNSCLVRAHISLKCCA